MNRIAKHTIKAIISSVFAYFIILYVSGLSDSFATTIMLITFFGAYSIFLLSDIHTWVKKNEKKK